MSAKILEEELKERLHTRRLDKVVASFSGACISSGHCYSIDNDENIFVKTNGGPHARVMFDGELEALNKIAATKTVKVPKPLTVMHNFDGQGKSAIAMEYFDMVNLTSYLAKSMGQSLADLHEYNNKLMRFNRRASRWIGKQIPSVKRIEDMNKPSETEDQEMEENHFSKHSMKVRLKQADKQETSPSRSENLDKFIPQPDTEEVHEFGFDISTSCGSIPQLNSWSRDWVSFYARQRLDYTIRMILSDHGSRELNEQWMHLQLKIPKFFSDFEYKGSREGEIIPALLHGDLWSGNVSQMADGSCGVLYDPASFYGHSEYEFGIARMFGGIPSELEKSYFDCLPKKKLFEERNKLYQLFHHLNHWNHFGSGYMSSSLRIMKDLNAKRI